MNADVIVRGEGQARAMPDRAIVHVVVDGEGSTRDDAYRIASRAAQAVDDVVARHDDAIDKASTASLFVHPTTRWRKGENVRTGWKASRATILEVTGLEGLGQLIADLSGAGASISGPSWQLDPTNSAYNEARRRAAEDARRRADDYAVALDLELGHVAWIAEPGLRRETSTPVEVRAVAAPASASYPAAAREDEVIDVTPDEMTVRAAVEVGFGMAVRSGSSTPESG